MKDHTNTKYDHSKQQPLIEQVSKGQLVFVFASGRKTEAVIFHVSLSPATFNINSFLFP